MKLVVVLAFVAIFVGSGCALSCYQCQSYRHGKACATDPQGFKKPCPKKSTVCVEQRGKIFDLEIVERSCGNSTAKSTCNVGYMRSCRFCNALRTDACNGKEMKDEIPWDRL